MFFFTFMPLDAFGPSHCGNVARNCQVSFNKTPLGYLERDHASLLRGGLQFLGGLEFV